MMMMMIKTLLLLLNLVSAASSAPNVASKTANIRRRVQTINGNNRSLTEKNSIAELSDTRTESDALNDKGRVMKEISGMDIMTISGTMNDHPQVDEISDQHHRITDLNEEQTYTVSICLSVVGAVLSFIVYLCVRRYRSDGSLGW